MAPPPVLLAVLLSFAPAPATEPMVMPVEAAFVPETVPVPETDVPPGGEEPPALLTAAVRVWECVGS